MRHFSFLICLFFSASTVFCQAESVTKDSSITITGKVIDLSNLPVSNATIILQYASASSTVSKVLSDTIGQFKLHASSNTAYRLQISSVGFEQIQMLIEPAGKDISLGKIVLKKDAKTLAEVIVKSEKPLIEQRADRLVYNAEKDPSTLGGTAADVLRNVPMVSVDANGNVQLRGSSNIRVLINNRPSSIMASSVADALRQLPADMIKSVEVITSPSAKYDAEGTAGIINIITKKNTLQGVTGTINVIPGNVSTIGNAGLNFRRKRYGLNLTMGTNQFYNHGKTYLRRLNYADRSEFIQDGKTRNRSGFINPQLGFDVALNEKNSIGGGLRFTADHDKVKNDQVVTHERQGILSKSAALDLLSRTKGRGYDANFDYLKTFKDPLQELSVLSMLSVYNATNEANQDEYNSIKETIYQQRNTNASQNVEGTLQADYTQPFRNKSTLEIGSKAILRKASSDVKYGNIYPQNGFVSFSENVFSYNQDVWAAYFTYAFKAFKQVNVKLGTRYERTAIMADFKTRDFSFETSYDNLIPSINAAYTFRQKHTLRFGYTQRLQRPQLFFLNPYREVVSPQVIRTGNPRLDPELAQLVEMSYGTYGKNFSFNSNVYGRITNNAITSILNLVGDTTYINFKNIAQNRTFGLSLSGSVKPVKQWSLNGNLNVYHSSLESQEISNSGWMYNFFASTNIELGKGWIYSFTGSFNSRRVNLLGRIASFYYHNTTLRKDILNKKGSAGINLANPFMKGTRFRTNQQTATFEQLDDNINYTRGVRLSLTYRFGKLQQNKAPRKPKKSINNDDALRG
ncbi:MAG TPA: TonB-dependent receptor [Flavisolibacter sp.]|nr:TonB-dependent receptor [Flavisolibacter sp.]